MVGSQWDLALLLAGMILVHLLFAYRAYRLREQGAPAGGGTERSRDDLVDADDGVVECPDCGTVNELGYRFCRACVSDLPGTMDFESGSDAPVGRFAN